jgi:hypothetical protein
MLRSIETARVGFMWFKQFIRVKDGATNEKHVTESKRWSKRVVKLKGEWSSKRGGLFQK